MSLPEAFFLYQACDFSGFYLNSGFLKFSPHKIHFRDSCKNEEKIGRDLWFTFVLLNRGVSDVETIYFVSIEQKKYNCLQKLPGVLVSKKNEVICSTNK